MKGKEAAYGKEGRKLRRMCWWLLTLAVAKGCNAAKVEISSSAHGATSENAATSN